MYCKQIAVFHHGLVPSAILTAQSFLYPCNLRQLCVPVLNLKLLHCLLHYLVFSCYSPQRPLPRSWVTRYNCDSKIVWATDGSKCAYTCQHTACTHTCLPEEQRNAPRVQMKPFRIKLSSWLVYFRTFGHDWELKDLARRLAVAIDHTVCLPLLIHEHQSWAAKFVNSMDFKLKP